MIQKILLAMGVVAVSGSLFAGTMRSSTIGGATGLITTPTARTSWESSQMGLDLGYHYVGEANGSHSPKAVLTAFNRWEIGGTFDAQGTNQDDLLFHTKFRFIPWSGSGDTAVALGANVQSLKGPDMSSQQIYLAVTTPGKFFDWGTETTFVFGKSMGDGTRGGDIDFSMGFDMDFLPGVFKGSLHWINDFANYSYSMHARGANAGRGIYNTGLRLAPLKLATSTRLEWKIDLQILDAMDDNRSFAIGTAFGMPLF